MSFSECQSLTLNVKIRVSSFVGNSQLCHLIAPNASVLVLPWKLPNYVVLKDRKSAKHSNALFCCFFTSYFHSHITPHEEGFNAQFQNSTYEQPSSSSRHFSKSTFVYNQLIFVTPPKDFLKLVGKSPIHLLHSMSRFQKKVYFNFLIGRKKYQYLHVTSRRLGISQKKLHVPTFGRKNFTH